MDPITLATVTSAVSVLGMECAKGMAGVAGKDLWDKIKSRLGFQGEPKTSELAQSVASRLASDEKLAAEIVALLKEHAGTGSSAGALVGSIDAEKVVVATRIDPHGDFNM